MEKNLTMLTDFYQLTMANGYLENGMAATYIFGNRIEGKVEDVKTMLGMV